MPYVILLLKTSCRNMVAKRDICIILHCKTIKPFDNERKQATWNRYRT